MICNFFWDVPPFGSGFKPQGLLIQFSNTKGGFFQSPLFVLKILKHHPLCGNVLQSLTRLFRNIHRGRLLLEKAKISGISGAYTFTTQCDIGGIKAAKTGYFAPKTSRFKSLINVYEHRFCKRWTAAVMMPFPNG